MTHDQDDAHDELEALKALKADYSAKTAAARADADYSMLVSVQEQVAALREELDVRTELEEAEALLAVQDPWQVDHVYQLVDAEGNYISRQAPAAGAVVSRPRQQSATRANRNRSRSASLRKAAQAAESSAAAASPRPRQQSATRANRNRSRSASLTAPPPVIADEHIPHVAVRMSALLRLHCGS